MMREISTQDVFLLAGLFAETNLLEEIVEFDKQLKESEEKLTDMQKGFKFFKILFKQLQNKEAQKCILKFLANIKGVEYEDYAKQSPLVTANDLKEFVMVNDIGAFFELASQSATEE